MCFADAERWKTLISIHQFKDPNTAGNTLLVECARSPAICVSDSLGNTYTEVRVDESHGWLWAAWNCLGGSNIVTVDAPETAEIIIFEVPG